MTEPMEYQEVPLVEHQPAAPVAYEPVPLVVPDDNVEYTGENGDGQTERINPLIAG